jgi:uncharacterized protein (TIGR02147 family)
MEQSVYSFEDYRKYLRSVYEARKTTNASLSLGSFSSFLGFKSANYFGLVVSGKRNLTVESIHKIASALHLTYEETERFEVMVLLSQATSGEERRFYKKRLDQLVAKKLAPAARFSPRQLVTSWQPLAILVGADRVSADQVVEKLVGSLPLPEAMIRQTLTQLLEAGLLELKGETYQLSSSHQLFHDVKSSSARHKAFLKSQLELSSRMLEKAYGEEAKFYSHTFSISKRDLKSYDEMIRSLLSEITKRSDQTEPDDVAQLNVQLFKIDRRCNP